MPRIEVSHVAEAFVTALVVNAHALEIGRCDVLPQAQVRMPQHGELAQRLMDVDLTVAKALRPEILVLADDRRTIVCEDHPEPHACDELGVSEMRKHIAHGPLARRLGNGEDLRRRGVEQLFERRRRFPEDLHRILISEQTEQPRDVGRGLVWCR